MILIRPIISNDNFDSVFKVMSAKFPHYKITHFTFVMNKNFVERYFETV